MRAKLVALAIACLVASSAMGHAAPDHVPAQSASESASMACLSQADEGVVGGGSCIGRLVAPCSEAAVTTSAQLACIAPEQDIWDHRLEAAYAKLMRAYESADADYEPIRRLAPLLRNTQQSWRAWRDAKCGFEYSKFRGGSLGRIASAYCHLEETANRSLELQALLSETSL